MIMMLGVVFVLAIAVGGVFFAHRGVNPDYITYAQSLGSADVFIYGNDTDNDEDTDNTADDFEAVPAVDVSTVDTLIDEYCGEYDLTYMSDGYYFGYGRACDEYSGYNECDEYLYCAYELDYPNYYESYPPYFVPIFTSEPLPEHIIEFITGLTFRDYAPFDLCFLTYLTVTHVDFDGEDRIGHMIVAAEIGEEVLEIFREIYEARFPIYSIKLIDYFDAIDYYSLAANNSSAFNFRYIANTNVISRHGFGMAIDINPIQNPYVRGDNVLPAAGRAYLDRSYVRPGMIVRGDPVYQAFISRGWTWGGTWTLPRDYHHFERRG